LYLLHHSYSSTSSKTKQTAWTHVQTQTDNTPWHAYRLLGLWPTTQVLRPSYWHQNLVPVTLLMRRAFWYQKLGRRT